MAPAVLLLTGIILRTQAAAGFFTGTQLLHDCASTNPAEAADCLGYITGIADAIGTAQPLLHDRFGIPPVVCVGPDVTRGHLREVVVAHLRETPAQQPEEAGRLVVEALMATFPCPDKSGPL